LRLLFDIAHPADLHTFRHLAARAIREGGAALVAGRDKDVTTSLLRAYQLPHVVLSRAGRGGTAAKLGELALRTARLFSLARTFQPDALVGPSASFGLIGRLIRRPSFVFCEDDAAVVPQFARIAYPLASYVVTPACLAFENYGPRHLTYAGYHELAYLHPAHFTPDEQRVRAVGIDPERPYFLLRLVALLGHHDTRARGLDHASLARLVSLLADHGRVLISSEAALPPELEPHRFAAPPETLHDVLAFAALVIGDSQKIAAEAAVLGVPNLRCNSFVGRISYLRELEERWGLTLGMPVQEAARLPEVAREWLADLPSRRARHAERRARMLESCVDVAEWQWRMLREKLPA
jgi:predicted glycosyltransferase